MEAIKYPYILFQSLFAVILFSGMLSFFIYMIITFASDYHIWLVMVPFLLIVCGMLFYFCKKFFFPLLKKDTALELDHDKLQFFITKRIIYWKDIESIENPVYYGIKFIMSGNNPDINISTKYIAGDDKTIYNTILEYFDAHAK